jgi:acetyl esterase/lipase
MNVIKLWETRAPLALGDEPADVPSIELVKPAKGEVGSCVLVCPGGGYGHLAPHEGITVGQFLASHGIIGAVLKYRIAPRYKHPAPMLDVSRGIRLLRHRAAELGVDPKRVAVLGFSAGGHLASTLSTQFDAGDANAADPIDRQSSRPDASVLCYPVITMTDPHTHQGSRNNLLGQSADAGLVGEMSNERRVTKQTPPTFVFHTADDAAVPVENALLYVDALRRAGVPFEAHLYEQGRHGVGLASDDERLSTWGPLMVSWLKSRGW